MEPMKPLPAMHFDDAPRWWPESLGDKPSAAGSANAHRYAYFAGTERLVIEIDGEISVYDTTGYDIQGVSQDSQTDAMLVIHDTRGDTISLDDLKRLN